VLAVAESGGHHIAFSKAARPWLITCGKTNGFSVDFATNMASVTTALLANYRVVLQLDFPPYGWPAEAMSAFKFYIEEGRGGWWDSTTLLSGGLRRVLHVALVF
jgi:hypothetical protein